MILFINLDWRLAIPTIAWIVFFIGTLVFFVPRICRLSTAVSEARSVMTGRLVDSYTNIQTVKLFAHADREDAYTREAIEDHNDVFRAETRQVTWMNIAVFVSTGLLIAGTMALAVYLWAQSSLTLGAIAVAAGMTIRISTMSGWIMWTAINVFEAMGTVQEGMENHRSAEQAGRCARSARASGHERRDSL